MSDADRSANKPTSAASRRRKAINPLDKEAWLRVAGEWLKMAAQPIRGEVAALVNFSDASRIDHYVGCRTCENVPSPPHARQ